MSTVVNLPDRYCEAIRVRGLVQGVGFRPTVWRRAQEFGISGVVRNDGSGVLILAQGEPARIEGFVRELEREPPALARIDAIERRVVEVPELYQGFEIQHSVADAVDTGFVADAATCEACRDEINEPTNRRFGYAFTNCTHCGPRLSIVTDIPYDRANTSMVEFEMCPNCGHEYEDPAHRRFHAQPNACPECGPMLQLCDRQGRIVETADPIAATAELIRDGYIIAIKGIGGFQLACDASNSEVVETLRARKHRPHKPLALMAVTTAQISKYCRMVDQEVNLLQSAAAPIVLLERGIGASVLAQAVAPGQRCLGFMLPNSPLHHLLMQHLAGPIVLTSGNRSGQPQCIDNTQALAELDSVADYFLLHNRAIVNRVDDSVLRVKDGHEHIYRRARGYAPAPLTLPEDLDSALNIVACGAELKNTFCLLRGNQATLSQHIGDLEDAQTCDDYENSVQLYRKLFQFDPQCIAVDRHPEYLSSKYGRALAAELGIPLVEVQHHHAHVAACLADNGWSQAQGRVIGITLDGLGYGDDDTIWGGEILLADYRHFERRARLKPAPMPGGTQAILEPWRNTLAQLQTHADWSALSQRHAGLPLFRLFAAKPLPTLEQMILSGFNSPLTSSCGRLFDAVAAALGLCANSISYEGQAAIELENCIGAGQLRDGEPYLFALENQTLAEINPAPMWPQLFNDLSKGVPFGVISARFHRGLAKALVENAVFISRDSGIDTVALCGGVFQNQSLLRLCREGLEARGLQVLLHRQVPANDGGLSLGQAAIASARINQDE